jgi:hypothetical protein
MLDVKMFYQSMKSKNMFKRDVILTFTKYWQQIFPFIEMRHRMWITSYGSEVEWGKVSGKDSLHSHLISHLSVESPTHSA